MFDVDGDEYEWHVHSRSGGDELGWGVEHGPAGLSAAVSATQAVAHRLGLLQW